MVVAKNTCPRLKKRPPAVLEAHCPSQPVPSIHASKWTHAVAYITTATTKTKIAASRISEASCDWEITASNTTDPSRATSSALILEWKNVPQLKPAAA